VLLVSESVARLQAKNLDPRNGTLLMEDLLAQTRYAGASDYVEFGPDQDSFPTQISMKASFKPEWNATILPNSSVVLPYGPAYNTNSSTPTDGFLRLTSRYSQAIEISDTLTATVGFQKGTIKLAVDEVDLVVEWKDSSGASSKGMMALTEILFEESGMTITAKPTGPGDFSLHVLWRGREISFSPLLISVLDEPFEISIITSVGALVGFLLCIFFCRRVTSKTKEKFWAKLENELFKNVLLLLIAVNDGISDIVLATYVLSQPLNTVIGSLRVPFICLLVTSVLFCGVRLYFFGKIIFDVVSQKREGKVSSAKYYELVVQSDIKKVKLAFFALFVETIPSAVLSLYLSYQQGVFRWQTTYSVLSSAVFIGMTVNKLTSISSLRILQTALREKETSQYQFMRALFDMIDADESGQLDFQEVEIFLSKTGHAGMAPKIFAHAAIEKSENIGFQQFCDAYKTSRLTQDTLGVSLQERSKRRNSTIAFAAAVNVHFDLASKEQADSAQENQS